MNTAKFIAFEGIDRSGKTTQMARLHQYLTETTNLSVWSTREPFDNSVRVRLKTSELSPSEQLDLLIQDRTIHCQLIKEKLGQHDVVLCDRFTDSTLAYQGYGHGFGLDLIRELNDMATGGIKPDMTILFDCPVEVAVKRNFGKPLDKVEQDLHFLDRVRFGYLELAREDNWVVIDATRSECQIFAELLGIIPVPVVR